MCHPANDGRHKIIRRVKMTAPVTQPLDIVGSEAAIFARFSGNNWQPTSYRAGKAPTISQKVTTSTSPKDVSVEAKKTEDSLIEAIMARAVSPFTQQKKASDGSYHIANDPYYWQTFIDPKSHCTMARRKTARMLRRRYSAAAPATAPHN